MSTPEPEAVAPTSAQRSPTADVGEQPLASSGDVADESAPWPVDESGEAAFLSDAKSRGETVRATPPKASGSADEKETEAKPLPPLEELVNRLSPEVRDTLDDLFRAKFVKVQRVPKKALKK